MLGVANVETSGVRLKTAAYHLLPVSDEIEASAFVRNRKSK